MLTHGDMCTYYTFFLGCPKISIFTNFLEFFNIFLIKFITFFAFSSDMKQSLYRLFFLKFYLSNSNVFSKLSDAIYTLVF